MSNIKQLKHLEHLEDEMLNYGTEGCMAAVSFLKELRKKTGKKKQSVPVAVTPKKSDKKSQIKQTGSTPF